MLLRMLTEMWSHGPMKLKVIIAASLLAVVPVVILGAVTYAAASHSLFAEVGKANRQAVRQIQERIDEKLIQLDKIVLQHAFNPAFKRFLSSPNPYEDAETFSQVMTAMMSMEGLIDDVNAVYLYMADRRLTVNPSQGIAGEDRLDPQLLQELRTNDSPFFWTDRKSDSQLPRGGSHMVTLVRQLPIAADKPLGYLIIEMNDRAFFKVFTSMEVGQTGEMLIVTPSGNVFSDWNKSLLGDDFDSPVIHRLLASDKEEEVFSDEIDGQRMLFNYNRSPYNGWKYISVLPVDELTTHVGWIKRSTAALTLLLMLISLTAAVLLARSLMSLLNGVVDAVKKAGRHLPQPQRVRNEFGIIRHYVESLHSANDKLEQQIQESMPTLRSGFLQRLLSEPMTEKEARDKLAYYRLEMPAPYFTVLCIELDDMRGQTEQDINLFMYAAINISREIVAHRAGGAAFRGQGDHIAVLINHGKDGHSQHELQAAVFEMAEELHEVIERLLQVTVTIGIGKSYFGLEGVPRSYREAKEALQFQLVQGSGKVIFIESVMPQQSVFVYPIEQEQTVVTGLKLGNLLQACRGVDEFASRLKDGGQYTSGDHLQQSFVQLIAASLKTLYELDPEHGPKIFDYNLYQRLTQLKSCEKIIAWLKKEIYPAIIGHIVSSRSRRQQDTIGKVLEHIHRHYDSDLSQPMLADLVSMPSSQFSSMFKETTGMTPSDYIIAYRIDQARELLTTTDLKVADIAERLRYNNAQNFIRVFKRMCGMTPGEYRLKYAGADDPAKKGK